MLCAIFQSVFFLLTYLGICVISLHTPQQNEVFKSKHKHILDTGLALLSHMLKWTLVSGYNPFNRAIYLVNRLPIRGLGIVSPYEKLFLTTFLITHAYMFLYVSVFLAYDLITNTKLIVALEHVCS